MTGSDEEISRESVMVLEAIDDEFREKVESCCKVLTELNSRAECFDDEARRLSARGKTLRNKAKWLKEYIQENMEAMGMDTVEGELFKAKVVENPPSVSVTNIDLVPSQFDRVRERELKKKDIKEVLKSGEEVPGCELVRTKSLRVT